MPEPMTIIAVSGGMGMLAYYARRYYLVAKEVLDIVLGTVGLIAASRRCFRGSEPELPGPG